MAMRFAAGVQCVARDGRVLFLKRAGDGDYFGKWCFPGGGVEGDETPAQAAARELREETGHDGHDDLAADLKSLGARVSGDLEFTTFRYDVAENFEAQLNGEHSEYVWADPKDPPQPLHPGVAAVLDEVRKQAADALLAQDKAMQIKAKPSVDALAMDRGTVRTYDQDGRLRVEVTNISKAVVNPYLGNEIPDWQELGLEPDRTYQLLRDPAELEKAVPTFNGIPLLDTHVPSTAWDHPFGKVVGTTGTDAAFEAPYLKNSLIVWTADAIQGIESGEQRELSCGYRYRADMTPGTYDGVEYSGVMRDILGNHVALVAAGRAGPDVLVGDSSTVKGNGMTKVKAIARKAAALRGALLVSPKLRGFAADAKVSAITAAITQANWKTERPKLEAAIKPKLAADADMQDLVQLLDAVEQAEEGMDDDPPAIAQPAVDADPVAEILAMLKGKVSDEELAGIAQKLQAMKPAAAADVDPDKKPGEENKDMVSKSAMDAALKAASDKAAKDIKAAADSARSEAEENTIKRLRSVREAEEAALPFVGKLAGAFDSAEAVYRAALTALDVKHDGIHESALRAVLEAQPKPGATRTFAHDSKPSADFATRFPGAAAVQVAG